MSTAKLMDLIKYETINDLLLKKDKSLIGINLDKEQLVEIFDTLRASINVGDSRLMEPILDKLLRNQGIGLNSQNSQLLDQIVSSIINISQVQLSFQQSQQLISSILPVYFHANQYLHRNEIEAKIAQINREHSSLEQFEKNKSDFISIAAHELKTPLTLMEGYSAMLRDLLEQKKIFDEHIFLLVDGMDSGSRRLREIINDMIDVSLIDNELLALTFQPTWLNKILVRVPEHFEEALRSRQIILKLRRFMGDNLINFCDGERIFQAISNVVANAIKYTPDGGRITIDGRRLHNFLEIVIADNGIGIDPEDHVKIFDKFQAVGEVALHSSGKYKFKGGGPGLGLPISKGIIEAHGGRIWVESEGYDELTCPGSKFYILLPIREQPSEFKSADLYEPLFIRNPKRKTN